MAGARTPGPQGHEPARSHSHAKPRRHYARTPPGLAAPGPTGTPSPRLVSVAPEAPRLSPYPASDLASASEDLGLLTDAFQLGMLASNPKIVFARYRAKPETFLTEAYLRARDAYFGSTEEYRVCMELGRKELDANKRRLRNSVEPNVKLRHSCPRWQEAQDVFYAWVRRGYEKKLGTNVNIAALIIAGDSERLRAALKQVSLRSGHEFTKGTFNPRPENNPHGYRLGTISEHAFGNPMILRVAPSRRVPVIGPSAYVPARRSTLAALATALLSGACSIHEAPSAAPNGTSTAALHGSEVPARAAETKAPAGESCKDLGLLPCEVPPSSAAELCARTAQCLMGLDDPTFKPPTGDITCGPLRDSSSAPAASGLRATAVVAIDGQADPDGSWRTGASYLVAETAGGFCLVDQLIPWDLVRDYAIDTDFKLTWSAATTPAPELHVLAHFVARSDSDEGTFVDQEWCYEDRYALGGGRFKSLLKSEREGGCQGKHRSKR